MSYPIKNWRIVLTFTAVATFALSVIREFASPGRPTPGTDAAFFEHAGWYMTQGAVPYVHMWDIKPPMTFYTTNGIALLSSGNMYMIHFLSVVLISAAGVAVVALVGELTHQLTDDGTAAVVAGLAVLCLAGFHFSAAQGFYPKYLAISLGLGGILLQYHNQPVYSGLVTALGAGYIQHTAVFAILVLGIAAQRQGRVGVRNTLLAMVMTTAVVVAPLLILGAAEAMVTEVIIATLAPSEPSGILSILRRLGKGLLLTGYAAIPTLLGAYGLIKVGMRNFSEMWWVVGGGGVYAAMLLFVDFDSYPDLFFGLVFVSIGVGLLVASVSVRQRHAIIAVVVVIASISIAFLGGVGVVTNETIYTQSLDDSLASSDTATHTVIKYVERQFNARPLRRDSIHDETEPPDDRLSMSELFWQKGIPSSCHYRLSETELVWVEQTNRSYTAQTCGDYPSRS